MNNFELNEQPVAAISNSIWTSMDLIANDK